MEAPRDSSPPQLFSFDCYGTLIDWERGLLEALAAWRRRTQLALSDDDLLAAYATAESSIQSESPNLPYRRVLAEALGRISVVTSVDVRDEEVRRFGASVGDWPAFDDSPAALRSLQSQAPLLVLSNIDGASFDASEARLGVRFDARVLAETVGAYKPDRRMFDALLARAAEMGVAPDGILHVAQSLFHDHVPAKRMGLRTAFIDRRRGRGGGATPPAPIDVTPDIVVSSLAELVSHLDSAKEA